MRRLVVLVGIVTVALLAPLAAKAHPLGNFTINRFSRIEVSGHRLYVLYVLDMAEIPTFQARQSGGIDGLVYCTADRGRRAPDRRRPAGEVHTRRACARLPERRRRAAHDSARGHPAWLRDRGVEPDLLPRHELRVSPRLEGDRRRRRDSPSRSDGAPRLSEGPAPEPARRRARWPRRLCRQPAPARRRRSPRERHCRPPTA